MLGATLPLICHFAIPPDDKAGARLSYLYLANILGSGAGSLLTGFVLMDKFSIQNISVLLAFLGLILSACLAFYSNLRGAHLGKRLALTAATGAAIFLAAPSLFDGLFERLQLKSDYKHSERFAMVVESRFGYMLKAFTFGAPPHGGIAFGLDRMVALLCGTTSIRDVIAFPKTQRGQDLMAQSPTPVTAKQLKELHIQTVVPTEE